MRVALIAPPFLPIPPTQYGGTEFFLQQLALGLRDAGVDVVVYTNGESTVPVERKWLYPHSEWPLKNDVYFSLRDLQHHAWALKDAAQDCDVVHVNNVTAVSFAPFLPQPMVYTVHHPRDESLAQLYSHHPEVRYACISRYQAQELDLPNSTTVHHGIDASVYRMQETKQDYLAFLGRIAPMKGAHLAIEVAKKTGIPLKLAGQIQPLFQDYWETQIKPHVDGHFIEFVGEIGLEGKNELLGNARAMLFPIQWHEPFGLVMVESMACGTPVLALEGGAVAEVVAEGVAGHVCSSVDELAVRARSLSIPAATVREYVEQKFSVSRMVEAYLSLYDSVPSDLRTPAGAAQTIDTGRKIA